MNSKRKAQIENIIDEELSRLTRIAKPSKNLIKLVEAYNRMLKEGDTYSVFYMDNHSFKWTTDGTVLILMPFKADDFVYFNENRNKIAKKASDILKGYTNNHRVFLEDYKYKGVGIAFKLNPYQFIMKYL